mmetsp:Transcript_14680/g.18598  ORF Transcript_14680/g.18598 Transcript_14680/m.18598 type:complete len:136 (-) Transcript_14680:384-791(-)|eukprot:CAMPEP_0203652500 /NCGR_PEP_ID=MMETSP0088-20131115/30158_1 /ASSEMBLY_ACC=CAM_ASM_001087 /TAXON_ID=426623 /ORGANISM="Chaetoceros affinis, Strain CCMP159" /LENGTH=135 /DNA_ID=CAMNT_0050512057 /DNA_START=79 /DNA_END=486 /DNA_ORIENTATION=+
MALGPIVKVFAQAAVMGVTILLRAIPAAYGAALQNARKSGVDAATKAGTNGSVFGTRKMALDEAMLILNLESKTDLDPKKIQQQYDRYFQANAVEKGGSFYLQSKIYRAKEMLDEYIKEKEMEAGQKDTPKDGEQ